MLLFLFSCKVPFLLSFCSKSLILNAPFLFSCVVPFLLPLYPSSLISNAPVSVLLWSSILTFLLFKVSNFKCSFSVLLCRSILASSLSKISNFKWFFLCSQLLFPLFKVSFEFPVFKFRVKIVASCAMDLKDFPMDTQKCGLSLGSCKCLIAWLFWKIMVCFLLICLDWRKLQFASLSRLRVILEKQSWS